LQLDGGEAAAGSQFAITTLSAGGCEKASALAHLHCCFFVCVCFLINKQRRLHTPHKVPLLTKGLWCFRRSLLPTHCYILVSGSFYYQPPQIGRLKLQYGRIIAMGTKQKPARGTRRLTGSYVDDEKLHTG
jgi:hypothetical protein